MHACRFTRELDVVSRRWTALFDEEETRLRFNLNMAPATGVGPRLQYWYSSSYADKRDLMRSTGTHETGCET